VVTAAQRRAAVQQVLQIAAVSQRTACRFLGYMRSAIRYRTVRPDRTVERERLKELAAERTRWGYRFLHRLLRREGFRHNWKLTYRLYREEGLHVHRRRRKRRAVRARVPRPAVATANQRWSMDFVSDAFSSGRRFRALTIVDDHTRECPVIEIDTSLPAVRVIEVLERLRVSRGLPQQIVVDNGPEFRSRALDQWAYARNVELAFIEPGKPVQNAFIESFNGTLRFECLDAYWFRDLADARSIVESWRRDYNDVRPHSSLGALAPAEYALQQSSVASRAFGASALDLSQGGEEVRSHQPCGLT
jgi:putative transposase